MASYYREKSVFLKILYKYSLAWLMGKEGLRAIAKHILIGIGHSHFYLMVSCFKYASLRTDSEIQAVPPPLQ